MSDQPKPAQEPEEPNLLQILSGLGINPFAVKLLVESYERHSERIKVSFVLWDTRITLEPAQPESERSDR